ncbi:MAG: DUF2147 domain-containing protein [Methylocystis sp.]|nr:DUF2147 domain-containing protein [Methylocystis sp.]
MSRVSYFDLRWLLAPVAAIALLAPPAFATNNDPHGVWLRPEGGEQFSFYDCGAQLCAKLISVKKAADQSSVGAVILRNAVKSGANEWKGKFFNTDDGKTYDGVITVNANEMHLKGCLWGVLCSGETWKRVAAAPAKSAQSKQSQAMAADSMR